MKKLIAFAVVFALIAGVAFAQVAEGISISGGASATFRPFIIGGPKYDGGGGIFKVDPLGDWKNGVYTKKAQVDSEGEIYTGLYGYGVNVNVNASSEYAGFGIGFNQGGISGGSFWVQPLGSAALRFGFNSGSLAITSNGLVEGLSVGLTLPKLLSGAFDKDLNNTNTFVDAWRQLKVSVGYTIADIGTISVGYNGGWAEKIDFNNLTNFQYVYKYNRAPPTEPRYDAPTQQGGASGTWFADGVTSPGSDQVWNWKDGPNFDDLLLTAKKNPILAVEDLGYGSANFTAGFSLSALSSMGLSINLGGTIWLPQESKFAGEIQMGDPVGTPGDTYTVERKYSGWADLSLGVNYNSGDFGVGFSFSATQLGKKNTLTYAGTAGVFSSVFNVSSERDDGDHFYKTRSRQIGTTEKVEPVKMSIGVTPKYTIDGTTISAYVNVDFSSESKETRSGTSGGSDDYTDKLGRDSEAQYKFGAAVRFKPFGKATLSVGIDVETPVLKTVSGWTNPENTVPVPKDGESRFFISVPITFGVSF
jgi:hypothetical protein